jgi:hypothetical protein
MAGMYGHRWASSYGTDPQGEAGDTWAAGLASLSMDQLARGLATCARSGDGWPPSMQEFRLRCLGVPAFFACLPQLRAGAPDVEPFVRLMWRYVDAYALRGADQRAERAMLRDAYDAAAAFVLEGGEIPPEVPLLEIDREVERRLYDEQHFARMRELIANDEISPRNDRFPMILD